MSTQPVIPGFTTIFEAIYNHTNDAILIADNKGIYVQVNAAAQKMLGYKWDELVGKSATDLIVNVKPDVHVEESWGSFLSEGQQAGIVEMRCKNGSTVICHYNAAASIMPGLHLSILTDITSREKLRREAEEKNRQVDEVLERINDCFFFVDKQFTVQYWNRSAEKLLRHTRREMIGKNLWEVFPDATHLLLFAQYKKAMAENVNVYFEDYYPALELWLEVAAYPSARGLAVYFKDITAQKRNNAELLQTKNNYAAILNSSPDRIWSVSADLKLLVANEAYISRMRAYNGRCPAEGDDILVPWFGEEVNKRWKSYYLEALASNTTTVKEECYIHPLTRESEYTEVSFNPIYDLTEKKVIAVACVSKDITQRKSNEKLIQQQHKKLQESGRYVETLFRDLKKIMDSSLDVICSIDHQGRFVQVSAASAAVWGYEPYELIGVKMMSLVHPDDKQKTIDISEKIRSGTKVFSFENRFKKKNGGIVPLVWSAHWDEQQQTTFSVAKDATTIKEAEKVKEESESRFSALVENCGDVITVLNKQLDIEYESLSVTKLFGYSVADRIGKNTLDYIHPGDVDKIKSAIALSDASGDAITCSYRLKQVNGKYRWIEASVSNQLNNPLIKGYVINKRDVTERKQTIHLVKEQNKELKARECLLKLASKRHKKIMDYSIDVICSIDENGKFLQVSKACERLWGYTADELMRTSYLDLVHPDCMQNTLAVAAEIMSGIDKTDFENVYIHKSGAHVPLLWSCSWDDEERITYAIAKDYSAVKEAEKIRAAAEKRFTALVENSKDVITIMAEDFTYTYESPAIYELTGYTPEELVGTNSSSFVHPDDLEKVAASFDQLTEEGATTNVTYRLRTASGNWKWFEGYVSRHFTDPAINGYVINKRDITDRRNYEDLIEKQNYDLQQTERKFTTLLRKGADVISIIDPQGCYTFISPNIERVFGYHAEDLIGTSAFDQVHPDDKTSLFGEFEALLKTSEAKSTVVRFLSADNEWRWAELIGRNLVDDPSIQGIVLNCRDVTERVNKDSELKAANERFEMVLKATNEVIYDWNLVADELYWNSNFGKMFGYKDVTKDKHLAFWKSHVHPEDLDRVVSSLDETLANKSSHTWQEEYRFIKADGNVSNVHEQGYIIYNENGEPIRFVGSIRDITEIKSRESERELIIKELTKSNSDLKQFTFITSHNLRAPLSNILGLLQIVDKENLHNENRLVIDLLSTAAKQLGQTLDDLGKILLIRNKTNVKVELIHFPSVFTKISNTFFNSLNDVAAAIHTDFAIEHIVFNDTYLESVFINLISNAIKYRSPKRKLQIKVHTEMTPEGTVQLVFADNGLGFDHDKFHDRVCGMYQRFHEGIEGQGLGLFIVKSQVDALGGQLKISSKVNEGTQFIITFNTAESNT